MVCNVIIQINEKILSGNDGDDLLRRYVVIRNNAGHNPPPPPRVELNSIEDLVSAMYCWSSYTPTFKNKVIVYILAFGTAAAFLGICSVLTFSTPIIATATGIGGITQIASMAVAFILKCLW